MQVYVVYSDLFQETGDYGTRLVGVYTDLNRVLELCLEHASYYYDDAVLDGD